jgi:signal transduction histidine kinase
VRWPASYRYLTRLNVPTTEAERSRVETVLGALRVLLAILALIAFSLDIPGAPQNAHLVYVLLAIYVAQSLAIFAWVSNRPVSSVFLRYLHAADILWPTLITAFSHGASSPFIPIYSFALLSAGFRWGFLEALYTAAAGCVVLEIEARFLRGTAWGQFESNRLLVHCAYLLALGYLIGTLGENEKERRAESAVVTRLLRSARTEHSLSAVLQSIFNEFISLFGASRIFLVCHDLSTDRVYLWQMVARPQRDARPYSREIVEDDRFAYLLPDYSATFFCEQSSPTTMKMLALGPKAQTRVIPGQVPSLPFLPGKPRSLLAVAAPLGHEWRLRMLLMDAKVGKIALEELSFARSLFEQAATAVYGVYLVRRLRARASAIERARVARELHDGAIQSLISAEMRTDMLRRRAEKEYPAIVPEIESLESLLRSQVIELRGLMQQLKPVEVEPDQLLDHLAEQVDRFRRDSGIAARFVSAAEEIHLSAYTCREILLIVQEALVNIRKHAKAEDVLVTFGRHDGYWRLSVSDDGVGFGFEGTLAGAELMKSAKGPAIIKERVANLGGELFINSNSSRGTQLLIKLPQKGYFSHGQ